MIIFILFKCVVMIQIMILYKRIIMNQVSLLSYDLNELKL